MRLLLLTLLACATVQTPERVVQGIAETMRMCLERPTSREHNYDALVCTCDAEKSCEAAGEYKLCAWDAWPLTVRTYHGIIAGRCEDIQ